MTKLRIAHINDTHSYFEPSSLQLTLNVDGDTLTPYVSAGGFARIATRTKQLRDEAQQAGDAFLFLHAGDCFQGTLYFSLFKGEANATMLNALGIDAMALGNHELDMGNLPVAQFAQRIEFPLLAGNWDLSQERQDKPTRLSDNPKVIAYQSPTRTAGWIERTVGQSKVAIFSLALDKMEDISNPDVDTPFVSTIETARATVAAIHQAGIRNIILLSHMGYDADLDIASHVDGIGLVIGGHSHRLQGDFSALGLAKDDEYGVKVNNTYVVQAGYHALSMGHCDIEFDDQGQVIAFNGKNELLLGRQLFIDASRSQAHTESRYQAARHFIDAYPHAVVCKKDPTVYQLLERQYSCHVRSLQNTYIADAGRYLRHVRIPDTQGPSELAPLVARSFVHSMRKRGMTVDFAIHNAGGVRNSLNIGQVSVADIAGKLLPFAVPIGVYEIEGQHLYRVIEGAINNALSNGVEGTGDGSYPYTYNLRFTYNESSPIGERITRLEVRSSGNQWVKVEQNQTYVGTSSAYTMKGKEGYDAILNMAGEGVVTPMSMADCFIEMLQDCPDTLNAKHVGTSKSKLA